MDSKEQDRLTLVEVQVAKIETKLDILANNHLKHLQDDVTNLKKTQYIILTPTHELAKQIYSVVENLGARMDISICKVIGKTNINNSIRELQKEPQIIVATPGRLFDMINKHHIFTDNIKTLVIDEADEMLSSGFMEVLQNIIRCMPKTCQMCLFSATMPKEIVDLTEHFMNNPEKLLINKDELTLEGIKQFYIDLKQYNWKFDVLYDYILKKTIVIL